MNCIGKWIRSEDDCEENKVYGDTVKEKENAKDNSEEVKRSVILFLNSLM